MNLYAYVVNDPVNFVDLTGEGKSSPQATLETAIARGDARQIEALMDALGPAEQAVARQALERLKTTAEKIISKEMKGSINQRFPGELRQKTLQEIFEGAARGDKACQTARKPLTDKRFRK